MPLQNIQINPIYKGFKLDWIDFPVHGIQEIASLNEELKTKQKDARIIYIDERKQKCLMAKLDDVIKDELGYTIGRKLYPRIESLYLQYYSLPLNNNKDVTDNEIRVIVDFVGKYSQPWDKADNKWTDIDSLFIALPEDMKPDEFFILFKAQWIEFRTTLHYLFMYPELNATINKGKRNSDQDWAFAKLLDDHFMESPLRIKLNSGIDDAAPFDKVHFQINPKTLYDRCFIELAIDYIHKRDIKFCRNCGVPFASADKRFKDCPTCRSTYNKNDDSYLSRKRYNANNPEKVRIDARKRKQTWKAKHAS